MRFCRQVSPAHADATLKNSFHGFGARSSLAVLVPRSIEGFDQCSSTQQPGEACSNAFPLQMSVQPRPSVDAATTMEIHVFARALLRPGVCEGRERPDNRKIKVLVSAKLQVFSHEGRADVPSKALQNCASC